MRVREFLDACNPIQYPYKKQRKTPIFLKILFEILTHTMLPSQLLIMISARTFFAFPKMPTFARIVFDILTQARPENLQKNVKCFGTERGEGIACPGCCGPARPVCRPCEDDAEDNMAESTKWMMCEATGPMGEVQGPFN